MKNVDTPKKQQEHTKKVHIFRPKHQSSPLRSHESVIIPSPSLSSSLKTAREFSPPKNFQYMTPDLSPPHGSSSAFLHDYPFYEGPDRPMGYVYYNARWISKKLDEPLYSVPENTVDGTKRKHRFVMKLYGILCANFVVMSLAIGLFAILTTCAVISTLGCALINPRWRRLPSIQFVAVIIASLFMCGFAFAIATTYEATDSCELLLHGECEKVDQYTKISAKDAAVDFLQLTIGTLFVTLFCIQTKIAYTSWLGFMIIITVHFVLDFLSVVIYFLVISARVWPSLKMSTFCTVIALWIYADTRRLMSDPQCAVTEKEYLFAVFQLEMDTLYAPRFVWGIIRRSTDLFVGLFFNHLIMIRLQNRQQNAGS